MKNMGITSFHGLHIKAINDSLLPEYSELLASSFSNFEPSIPYLEWLYFKNPRGLVVGFDAFDGGRLIAHYACIPIKINGYRADSLLSLNTATLPSYQGRGVFRALADQTFEKAASKFANVIGVANSLSVRGFVGHLGFEKLGNLELRFGKLQRKLEGSRIYSEDDLIWRSSCPGRSLRILPLDSGSSLVSIKPLRLGPKLQSIVHSEISTSDSVHKKRSGFTLDWRNEVNPLIKLPKCLKPSPLALIFKPLLEPNSNVLTSFSFPDFDAF